jgi:hypothetical protein
MQSGGLARIRREQQESDIHIMKDRKRAHPQPPRASCPARPLEMPHKPPGKATWLPPTGDVVFFGNVPENDSRGERLKAHLSNAIIAQSA